MRQTLQHKVQCQSRCAVEPWHAELSDLLVRLLHQRFESLSAQELSQLQHPLPLVHAPIKKKTLDATGRNSYNITFQHLDNAMLSALATQMCRSPG